MECRTTPAVNFTIRPGFSQHDPIMTKEQTILSKIVTLLAAKEIILQHSVLRYRIDAYFLNHKLEIEFDESGHNSIDNSYEIEKQKAIENKPGCEFIRINPAKETLIFLLRLVEYIVLLLFQ